MNVPLLTEFSLSGFPMTFCIPLSGTPNDSDRCSSFVTSGVRVIAADSIIGPVNVV